MLRNFLHLVLLPFVNLMKKLIIFYDSPCGSVVEHPLWDREVVDSNPRHTKGVKNGTSGYLAWCSAL